MNPGTASRFDLPRLLFALVWFGNGLGAKLLGLVPRHRAIVARLLGADHAASLTLAIGLGEVVLGIWVLSGRRAGLCAAVQISLVLVMNLIEFAFAADLLLFGRLNLLLAILFGLVIYRVELGRRPPVPEN